MGRWPDSKHIFAEKASQQIDYLEVLLSFIQKRNMILQSITFRSRMTPPTKLFIHLGRLRCLLCVQELRSILYTLMKPCLILVNGYPGVGKKSIAKLIHQDLDATTTFIHNHLLIDPVVAIHPSRNEAHYALRKRFRQIAFEALIKDSNTDRIIILTVCLGDNQDDIAVMLEHLHIARERRIPVFWVNLLCNDVSEHERRIASDERKRSGMSKCTDPVLLREIKNKSKLLATTDIMGDVANLSLAYYEQDTSNKSIKECAQDILQWIESVYYAPSVNV
jgi:hypothetical protein